MKMKLEHDCNNDDGNAKNKGAGQTTMQTTERERNANWLQRWLLITAFSIFPALANAVPDLVMMSVSSTTTQVNTKGGAITIKDTERNQGADPSTVSNRVGYYLSADNVITTADTLIGSRNVGILGAGANSANTAGITATIPAGLPLGTYYIGAIADDTGLQAETDETNNALAGTTITVTQPDLVMTAVSSTTIKLSTLGGSITVSYTQRNQGAVASTVADRLGFYLSTDNVITTADTYIGDRSGYILAAGASGPSSATLTVPAGLAPGTYYLGAIADYTGLEPETDETNNAFAGTTITIALPDLVLTAVGSTVTKVALGGAIPITYTIKNQGEVQTTVASSNGYYLSTDNVITTADTRIGTVGQGGLTSGQSQASGSTANAPASMVPGLYYIGVIADYTGLQPETDETNNTLAGPMIAVGLPDLTMTAISTNSAAVIPGNPFTVADTLKNQGTSTTTTGCRSVGYYLSTDNIITADDTLIGNRQQCGALAAAASSAATATTVTVPAGMPIGNYYLGAIADYALAELESDEANNALAGAAILVANVPDAPTNANATGGHTQATVTFNAPANDGGSAITGYTVTSSPAGGVDSNAGTAGLSHVVTGLTNGTAYILTVTATNAAGTSLASAASNSVTPAPLVPDAPTNVSATGGHTKATVSFSAPASDGGAAITGYTVTSSPGGVTAAGTASPVTITGLTNGVAYTFTVTATNVSGAGLPSAASNSVTPAPTAPDTPTNVKGVPGDRQVRITFNTPAENGSPITGYTVTSNPGGVTATGPNSPVTITGLTNGTSYTFTVTATNAIGTSLPSAPSNNIIVTDVPLAYFIDTDHLGTPRQITDTAGNVVWQWDNADPFGNNVPNENPNGAGLFSFNLRFPGQYADKETNTYYNINRDYDPATGRYVQSDPIGLRGGSFSTFTYVNSSPLSYVDPLGLYESSPILRATIPGQIAFDNAVTAAQNGDYGTAALDAGLMLGEQVISVLTLGASSAANTARTATQCVAKEVAAEGKTVLGHYPEYKSLAESLGARRFNIPESAWNKMTEAERWGANQKFLDRMISRGDDVILATPLDKVRPGSYFARELEYLSGRGYVPSVDGTRLILQGGK